MNLRLSAWIALVLTALGTTAQAQPQTQPPRPRDVIETYASIAQAMYGDAHATAQALSKAIAAFLAEPTEDTLKAAKAAWVKARVPYQQSEGFRFGNKVVDEWEGKVNAWPLDEGLIDYVDAASYGETSDENPLYRANIIGSRSVRVGRKQIDTTQITKKLLADTLQEAGGVESNVATGYHAVEFLLWGQDLNGTKAGAGARPATDYSLTNCTHGNCERRRQYLTVATEPAGRRSRRDGESLGRQGQSASGPDEEERRGRSVDNSHRSRLTLVWRTRGRAHEAGADPARSRRRA